MAAAVRIPGALHYAFWQDEVGSARTMVERTPLGVAEHVARTESTPPLWYVLGWFLHRLGLSLDQVRLLSAAAGALLAGGAVLYARTMLPLWASGLVGLALALGYSFVFHGRELRSYELHSFLSLALAASALAAVHHPRSRRLATLALVVAVGSLTNYFFLLSVAVAAAWVWLSAPGRDSMRRALAAIGIGLLPFVAWLPAMVKQYRNRGGYSYIGPFNVHQVLTTYWGQFERATPRTAVLHQAAPLALLAGVLAGAALLWRRSEAGRLTALLAVGPLVLAAGIWLAGPRVYDLRNLIGVGPFAAIALGALAASLRPPAGWIVGPIVAGLLVVGFIRSDRVKPVAYDKVARALVVEGWRPSDPIILFGNFYAFLNPLEWYLPHQPGLTLGEPVATCRRVFVVALGSAGRRRTLDAEGLAATRRVRGILVAKVDGRDDLSAWPGSRVLVAATGHDPCVRAVPERLLRSRLAA